MKMVSAAKLKGDETRLALAKPFHAWTTNISDPRVHIVTPADVTYSELPQKTLIVPLTSDKGLCGGINSFISRAVKDCVIKLQNDGKECDIVVVGDKGRSQLARAIPEKLIRAATEAISPGTFYLSAALYNQYYQIVKPMAGEGEDEPMIEYEFEPDVKAEVTQDLYEYLLTSELYHAFMDGAAAEQSSRMTAMENASKNAGEMIDSLTLKYNRARQTRITTELIEIISGASALEEGK